MTTTAPVSRYKRGQKQTQNSRYCTQTPASSYLDSFYYPKSAQSGDFMFRGASTQMGELSDVYPYVLST